MKRKLLFLFIAALLLFPWTVAYAYDDAAAATGPVGIVPAVSASLPRFNAYGHAIGGVTPGDLFLIDSSNSPDDTAFTLCITNTDELIHDYRYITLNIGTYIQTATGEWANVSTGEGTNPRETYLTMQNGAISFMLAGGARYKITIDKGCFYCYGIGADRTLALPDFYLTVS
jgi:hypothetical protein